MTLLLLLCVLAGVLSPLPAPAQGPATRVDTFETPLIDPGLWADLEFVRQVIRVGDDEFVNHVLQSKLSRLASGNRNTLYFADGKAVSSFAADVTVTQVENPAFRAAGVPRARLTGFFYNTLFAAASPGDGFVGEVNAEIGIRHSRENGFMVVFFIGRCEDPACDVTTSFVWDRWTFGPVALGETHRLSLAWDGSRFTFGFDEASVTVDPTEVFPVAGPSKAFYKGIGTTIYSEAFAPTDRVFIAALFDNVSVNAEPFGPPVSPYDGFESGFIDPGKWATHEFVRHIIPEPVINGGNRVYETAVTRLGQPGNSNLNLRDPRGVKALQADVKVTDFAVFAGENGASVFPRLRLHWGVYSAGPGSRFTNDVHAGVEIRFNGTGLAGSCFVSKCTAPNCNVPGEFETLFFDGTSFGSVALNEWRELFLGWDGRHVTCRIGETSVSFDPTAVAPVAGPAREKFIGLSARVTGIDTADEGGFIRGTFDDFVAFINAPPTLDAIGERFADEGALLQFTVSAADPDEDTLTFRASNLPPGATFDPATRQFSWTPGSDQAGLYPAVRFEVTDGIATAFEEIAITVDDTILDSDRDGFPDAADNCPQDPNPTQSDVNGNGIGDACDDSANTQGTVDATTDLPEYTVTDTVIYRATVTLRSDSGCQLFWRPDEFNVIVTLLGSAGEKPRDQILDGPPLVVSEIGGSLVEVCVGAPQTFVVDIPLNGPTRWHLTIPPDGYLATGYYISKGAKDPDRAPDGSCLNPDPTECLDIVQLETPAGSQSFTVRDPGGATSGVGALSGDVQGLGLRKGLENSLLAKLKAAQSQIQRGHFASACGQLGAFTNEVRAQSGKALTSTQAGALTSAANQIRTQLVCR